MTDLADDLHALVYFHEDKGDVERYYRWSDMQSELQEKYPEVLKAWHDLRTAETIFRAVLRDARDRASDHD